jgi:hypothetical protein
LPPQIPDDILKNMNTLNKKMSKTVITAMSIILFIIASALFTVWFGCPYMEVLRIPCPGCGMSRAMISFFSLDIKSAFLYHPAFPLVLLIPVLYLVYLLKEIRHKKRLEQPVSPAFLIESVESFIAYRPVKIFLFASLIFYLAIFVWRVVLPLTGNGDPFYLRLLIGLI